MLLFLIFIYNGNSANSKLFTGCPNLALLCIKFQRQLPLSRQCKLLSNCGLSVLNWLALGCNAMLINFISGNFVVFCIFALIYVTIIVALDSILELINCHSTVTCDPDTNFLLLNKLISCLLIMISSRGVYAAWTLSLVQVSVLRGRQNNAAVVTSTRVKNTV